MRPLSQILIIAASCVVPPACALARRDSNITTPGESPAVAAARTLFNKGNYEDAQSAFAAAKVQSPSDAAAWEGFGDASYQLFLAAVADRTRGNAALYLQDADGGYAGATAADPSRVSAWIGRAKVARDLGDGAKAGEFAQKARDAITKTSSEETKFNVLLALGEARAFEYQQSARRNDSPVKQAELYQRSRDAYNSAKAVSPRRAEPVLRMAYLEYQRSAPSDAITILTNAIHESPEEYQYHQYLCDIALASQLLPKLVNLYEGEFAREAGSSPTTRWYVGYVKMREAENFRLQKDYDAAARSYALAKEAFRESAAKNANFTKTSKQQEALSVAGEARILYEKGKFSEAADRLTRAFEADPTIISLADGLNITPKITSQLIGGEYFKNRELKQGAEWFERWLQFAPDDVDWLNNAGLMRRDLGEELSQSGKEAQAKECFEISYKHYSRVAELAPNEPRLVNDAALLLLYHLNRDLDKAEEMFRRAIQLGTDKLDEMGGERPEDKENDPESQRRAADWDYLAEATGDAYQNLGLLLWQKQGDSAEIRKLFMNSFQLDPRGTRSWLRDDIKELPESGPAPKRTKPLRQ